MTKATSARKSAPAAKKTTPRSGAAKSVPVKPAPAKKSTAAKATVPAKAAKPASGNKVGLTKTKAKKAAGHHGGKKDKTVRDSFNMPAADYALIGQLKARALAGAREAKKSELLRAGLRQLAGMTDAAFLTALGEVPSVKTGRPNKKHKS